MWQTLVGSLTDVNRTNRVEDQLMADFVCDASGMAIDAVTTAFVTVGERPLEIHWRADGRGWIILRSGRRIKAGDNDHDFFDLPKLVWPQHYPALAEICSGDDQTVVLNQAAARLLGNGRAHLVTATLDRELGLIRSYRSQAADGSTLRSVDLTYTVK
jgi:hypothetical protein